MRPARFQCAGALLALTACSEPDLPLAPLGEICGVDEPVRLLELAPDQAVTAPPLRIGDRLFYDIGRPRPDDASYTSVIADDRQLWMTGPCGEAPTRLDEQYERVFEIERWPGLALACDHDGNIVSLAATGPLAPNVVFRSVGCDPVWSARGPLGVFIGQQLLLHTYPDDPRSEAAKLNLLPSTVAIYHDQLEVAVAGEELLVMRPTQELVSIDLGNNAVTSEQTGVIALTVSPSGRYFLWTPGDENSASSASLQDRETGQGVYLGELALASNRQALTLADQGLVYVYLATGEQRIYRLPNLAFVVVPPQYRLDHTLIGYRDEPRADGQWILRHVQDRSLHTIDPGTGIVTPMFGRPGQVLAQEPEGTLVLAVPECCEVAPANTEGPVWFIPDDGADLTRIAARSTLFGWRPRPDSLITLVNISSHRRARLVRVDTGTLAEQLIDDHVFEAFIEDQTDPDIIRYSVQDGERSGVWQVRLP